jgi:hypothetical protein
MDRESSTNRTPASAKRRASVMSPGCASVDVTDAR